jgi:UDP-2-acetamido-2-deoxy-ribo-hexuluronate aminotransferase
MQGAYVSLGQGQGSFPESERAAQRIISLPLHPYLDEETQRTIIDAVTTSVQGES